MCERASMAGEAQRLPPPGSPSPTADRRRRCALGGAGDRRPWPLLAALAAVSFATACAPASEVGGGENRHATPLRDGWHLRAAAEVEAAGAEISSAGFSTEGWYETDVPETVLAALISNGLYPDPFFGKNLEDIPTEQFEGSWWYRTRFEVEKGADGYHRLDFDGINYRADVWLNGVLVADRDTVLGAFRRFSFDVTDTISEGTNTLAVEVFPPRAGDLTIGFVDWNPTPPDRNMGLWRGVSLRTTGAVSVDDVAVRSDVDLETLAEARLAISARLENRSQGEVMGEIVARVEDREVRQAYSLGAGEVQTVLLEPERHAALVIANPRLWWPNLLGDPELYRLDLRVTDGELESDATSVDFGIREVSDYLNAEGHRGYRINGREVLIRGGGWVDDLFLDEDPDKIEAQVLYAKHMNLNTLRLEGFWGSTQTLYDLADRHGLMVMPGYSCQWEWEEYLGGPVDEFGGVETDEQIELVTRSLADQVTWLRNHPSIVMWVLASDMLPRPKLEESYLSRLEGVDPTRPALASCAVRTSAVSGPTGVKMNGPYDWVPPSYWYVDTTRGGAFGFNTETGPGPQPPPLESVRRMLPEEHLWPIDEMWEFHCGRNQFNTLDRYVEALERRYGPPRGVETFLAKAQLANYEAMRPMFEAFAVNRPTSTGVIQWMLNSAWPEMYWQLYDYYLMPNGAFYGAKTANQPLNLVYHYGDRRVYAVNQSASRASGLVASIEVLDVGSRTTHEQRVPVELEADSAVSLAAVPLAESSPISFVDLRLERSDGTVVGRNFYWLPAAGDVLDHDGAQWFVTPVSEYADLQALASLPAAELEVGYEVQGESAEEQVLTATLRNPGETLAFFVELRALEPDTDRSILPVLWADNYVSLLPGEERTLAARFGPGAPFVAPRLVYSGINVAAGEARERSAGSSH
jgi:exo-1,4-beta-D-glucosaminidase